MRTPKDPKQLLLQRKADNSIERVFQLLRKHQGEIEPPALKEAFENYSQSARQESEYEFSTKEENDATQS